MKFLKTAAVIILIILTVIMMRATCFADDYEADFGTDELIDALPYDVRITLEDNNITPGGGAENITIESIFGGALSAVMDNITEPLRMFTAVLAVILLTSVLNSAKDASSNKNANIPFSIVSAITSTAIITTYLSGLMSSIGTIFGSASDFMLTYIPVLTGVIAAEGQITSAAVFSGISVAAIQILAKITTAVIIPLSSCILGISAVGCISGDIDIGRLGNGIKRAVIWGMGLIMTVFLGLLSIQGTITAANDSVVMKTAKFAVSSAVPFVGGAVSDALSTVKSSLALFKTGIGGFGAAAGACILVPSLIKAVCYRFFLFLASVVSDIFGCSKAGKIIKSGENVMSVIMAALTCFLIFIIVSSAMMIVICHS